MQQSSSILPDREDPVGSFVRRLRKRQGLTQVQLAELVGVGTRFISDLERGKRSLRRDTVEKVLAAFGMRLGVVAAPREELT